MSVKARVLYSGSLSRMDDISQGTGQGKNFAPFMYKVYINGPLNVLSNHCYAIFISGLSLSSPSFADDISLITFTLPFYNPLGLNILGIVCSGDMNLITLKVEW